MPKYRVTLADGRTTDAHAPDESGALGQGEHWDRERFIIAIKRAQDPGPTPAKAVSAIKLKD
jgi:hypothetical protein